MILGGVIFAMTKYWNVAQRQSACLLNKGSRFRNSPFQQKKMFNNYC